MTRRAAAVKADKVCQSAKIDDFDAEMDLSSPPKSKRAQGKRKRSATPSDGAFSDSDYGSEEDAPVKKPVKKKVKAAVSKRKAKAVQESDEAEETEDDDAAVADETGAATVAGVSFIAALEAKAAAATADGEAGATTANGEAVAGPSGTVVKPAKKERVKIKQVKAKKRTWADLDALAKKYKKIARTDRPLDDLPLETLDRILGDGSLTLRDHLALSGTNKAFRALYSEDVWKGAKGYFDLWSEGASVNGRPTPRVLATIATQAGRGFEAPAEAQKEKKPASATQQPTAGPSANAFDPYMYAYGYYANNAESILASFDYDSRGRNLQTNKDKLLQDQAHIMRDRVVRHVNGVRMNKTEAKKAFKVSDSELANLPVVIKAGFMGSKSQNYVKAAVEALALKAHGGPLGHAGPSKATEPADVDSSHGQVRRKPQTSADIDRLRKTAEKARNTRIKNGTQPKREARTYNPYGFPGGFGGDLEMLMGLYEDGYDSFGEGCECGECGGHYGDF